MLILVRVYFYSDAVSKNVFHKDNCNNYVLFIKLIVRTIILYITIGFDLCICIYQICAGQNFLKDMDNKLL